MSKQNMVPCISGKCGVQSHVVGSREQKSCAINPGLKIPAPVSRDLTPRPAPRTTTQRPRHDIAAQKFLQDSHAQAKALDARIDEQVNGHKNPIKRLWHKIRYDANQRADMAWKRYEASGAERNLQRSFLILLRTSQDARPTPRTGESVAPLDNFRGTTFGSRYSNIQYFHHAGNHPRITATQETLSGRREISVRYENDGITLKVIDPQTRQMLREEYHSESSIVAQQGQEGGRDPYRESSQSLMDLLIHVQNENNWK